MIDVPSIIHIFKLSFNHKFLKFKLFRIINEAKWTKNLDFPSQCYASL